MNKNTLDFFIYWLVAFIFSLLILICVGILLFSMSGMKNILMYSTLFAFALAFPIQLLVKMMNRDYTLKKYWDKLVLSSTYFENNEYDFYQYNDNSGHWWNLHEFVSKFNKLNKLKFYTAPYTHFMNERDLLTTDTAQVIKHMFKEVNYLNALNIKSFPKAGSIPLYDNTIFERKEIIKRRWELFLTKLSATSEEYAELRLKYDNKFGISIKGPIAEIIIPDMSKENKKSVDHLNQDLM